MKKYIYMCVALAGMLFVSCEKDEIGGTATEALAGEWYVTVDAVDANGETVLEDPFGIGHVLMNTYNTVDNVSTKMWVDDKGAFWNFKVVTASDVNNLTFTTNGEVVNSALNSDGSVYDCKVNISDGKMLPGAATNPHGTKSDSIVFYVAFDDDTYPAEYGYAKYKVSGYRYTGLASDD